MIVPWKWLVGDYQAVSNLPSKYGKLTGFKSWLIWRSVYLTKLGSWRNRMQVPFDWARTFFFGRDTSRFWRFASYLGLELIFRNRIEVSFWQELSSFGEIHVKFLMFRKILKTSFYSRGKPIRYVWKWWNKMIVTRRIFTCIMGIFRFALLFMEIEVQFLNYKVGYEWFKCINITFISHACAYIHFRIHQHFTFTTYYFSYKGSHLCIISRVFVHRKTRV